MLNPDVRNRLEADGTTFVRLTWADANGMFRGEGVHVTLASTLERTGLGVVTGVMGTTSNDLIPPGLVAGAVGQIWLDPDPGTLRHLPWTDYQVSCMGDLVTADGSPWTCCPRSALRRQIDELAERGLCMQVGFEPEFTLLHRDDDDHLRPADTWHYASIHGLNSETDLLEAMTSALEAQGVVVRTVMAESGSGQYELAIGHDEPLVTADRILVVRETITAIAHRHGLVATMLPKVLAKEAGNGCHVHLSLLRDGENCMCDGVQSFTSEAASFIAGVLDHLPALVALMAPSPASAIRIGPGAWAGAFQCWGWDNKEAPIRAVTERSPGASPRHVEIKTVDATCNPHLALAGLIACGLDGLTRGCTLPQSVQVDPATMSEPPPAMPDTVEAAVAALESDAVLRMALGEDLHQICCAVRRMEARHHEGRDFDELVSALATTW